jgi:cytoskeleton protein RodZ
LSAAHSDTPVSAAAGIGRSLRQAREARGLTLGDAAHALKLTQRQVEALEAEQFEHLPGTAFARGFLRNYARLLQLEPEPLIADFDALYAGAAVELRPISNAQGALPAGGARGPSALPAALAAAALLGLVVAGWYFDWFHQPKALVPTDSTAPVAVLPPLEAAAPATAPAGPGAEVAAPGATVSLPPPTVEGVPAAPADGLERLTFSFDQEAWVEVRDASEEIIFSRISKAGSVQEVQGRGPFALVVGNARNVKLSHNGKPVDLTPHIQASVARLTLK